MATIKTIQKELFNLTDKSIFAESIRVSVMKDFVGCVEMIISQAKDNRPLVAKIIGEPLLLKIENHCIYVP